MPLKQPSCHSETDLIFLLFLILAGAALDSTVMLWARRGRDALAA